MFFCKHPFLVYSWCSDSVGVYVCRWVLESPHAPTHAPLNVRCANPGTTGIACVVCLDSILASIYLSLLLSFPFLKLSLPILSHPTQIGKGREKEKIGNQEVDLYTRTHLQVKKGSKRC